MEADKSKIGREGWQAEDLRKSRCCSLSPKAVCCRIVSYLREVSLLFYSGLQLTPILWGAIWFTQSLLIFKKIFIGFTVLS